MKVKFAIAAGAIAVTLAPIFAAAPRAESSAHRIVAPQEIECVVEDTSGTDLNVRVSPNGKIVRTLKNGIAVQPEKTRVVNGVEWTQISVRGKNARRTIIGWVAMRYLSCE